MKTRQKTSVFFGFVKYPSLRAPKRAPVPTIDFQMNCTAVTMELFGFTVVHET